MSFSGGVYTLPGPALNTGEVVSAPENNTFRNDVATAFNLTFLRNGTSTATANLPMGGYKLTGLGVATTSGDALSYGQAATVSTLTTSSTVTLSGGTANGVAYLNGSKVLTTGSALTFDGSKMGIGTSSPTQMLSVVGAAFVGSSFNGASIGDSTAERVRIGYKDGTPDTGLVAAQIMQSGASELHITSTDTGAGAIVFRTGTGISERMRLDSSGNLGLGATPSVWTSTFKAIQVGSAASVVGYLNRAYLSANWYYDGTTNKYMTSDYATRYGQLDGQHQWYTAPSGTAGNAISFTQAMTLDASGNLGIGTSSLNHILDIQKSAASLIQTSVYNSNASGSCAYYLRNATSASATGSGAYMRLDSSNVLWLMNQFGNPFVFGTNNTERMRIDSSGNLLVGTATNISAGKVGVLFNGSTQNGIDFKNTNTGNTGAFLLFTNSAAANIGNITQNGASNVAYNTASDYRLKENIQPMQNALEFCRKQRPVTYDWKSDGSKGSGYIAHWLQEDGAGNCVTGEKDAVDAEGNPVYQGIDTSFMVGPLNAGLNELADIVDKQAELLTQLKAELDVTKAEVAALKGN